MNGAPLSSVLPFGRLSRLALYTLLMFLVQAHVISRLPYPALRADLLLPLMFGAGALWSPLAALCWASFWGFAVDNFSGEFWGLHVGSYMMAVCLVYMASDRFDCCSPVYQMCVVGICAAGQSIALGFFLSFVPMDVVSLSNLWIGLAIRTLLCMTSAPFLIYPILSPRSLF